jgi:hypothetical protein
MIGGWVRARAWLASKGARERKEWGRASGAPSKRKKKKRGGVRARRRRRPIPPPPQNENKNPPRLQYSASWCARRRTPTRSMVSTGWAMLLRMAWTRRLICCCCCWVGCGWGGKETCERESSSSFRKLRPPRQTPVNRSHLGPGDGWHPPRGRRRRLRGRDHYVSQLALGAARGPAAHRWWGWRKSEKQRRERRALSLASLLLLLSPVRALCGRASSAPACCSCCCCCCCCCCARPKGGGGGGRDGRSEEEVCTLVLFLLPSCSRSRSRARARTTLRRGPGRLELSWRKAGGAGEGSEWGNEYRRCVLVLGGDRLRGVVFFERGERSEERGGAKLDLFFFKHARFIPLRSLSRYYPMLPTTP